MSQQKWLYGLVTTVVVTAVSYRWLDRPLSKFFDSLFPSAYRPLVTLAKGPDPVSMVSVAVFVAMAAKMVFSGRKISRFQELLLLGSLAVITTQALKNTLKFVFGRTWPHTWIHENMSYLRDGAYGFHFFQDGPGYGSFPSGHTAVAGSVIALMWAMYPAYRPLYCLAGLSIAGALVCTNLHFLSDVVAGGFVGVAVGYGFLVLWNLSPARPQEVELITQAEETERHSKAA